MYGMVTIDLDKTPAVVENQGRGHPRGSKNKVKATIASSLSTVPGKRRRGRPLGSKNKKPSVAAVGASTTIDLGLAQLSLPQRSPGNVFWFFAFANAQCREHQRLSLKFAEFMDCHEVNHAILWEISSGGPPYGPEVRYDIDDNVSFACGWTKFAVDHDLHNGWFLIFNYHCDTSKFDV
jgi:hypothetical protein